MRSTPLPFTKNNSLSVLISLGAVVSILWSLYFLITTLFIPYQIELREGASQVIVRLFLSGENPYMLENQPLALNIYGLGYPLLVLPFARLFGNTLLVHRSVTLVFIVLSSVFTALVVYRSKNDLSMTLTCCAFVMIALAGHAGNGAFSSAMGAFLFLTAGLIPRLRSFDRASLAFSVLLCLAAFYTKPYFVLAFGVVASYLFLFVSKRKALVYAASFLLLFALTFLIVRSLFPLYFVDTIIVNTSVTSLSHAHMLAQLSNLLRYFYPILFLAVLLFVTGPGGGAGEAQGESRRVLNFSEWQAPLLGGAFDFHLYVFACSLAAFILVLGPHIGNDMNYAYQLLVPTFLCWFFQRYDFRKTFAAVAALAVIFTLFSFENKLLPASMLRQGESAEWRELFSYVHSSSNILNSSVEVSEVVYLGLTPIDSGQTIVFYLLKPFSDTILSEVQYDALFSDGVQYTRFIDRSVEKQKFDLIITVKEKSVFYHVKLVKEYYTVVDEIVVEMPQASQRWTLLIWRPRP